MLGALVWYAGASIDQTHTRGWIGKTHGIFSPAPGEHASWSPQGPPLTDTLRLECARTLGGRPLRSTPEQGQGRVV